MGIPLPGKKVFMLRQGPDVSVFRNDEKMQMDLSISYNNFLVIWGWMLTSELLTNQRFTLIWSAPGRFESNFRYVIFNWILEIDVWGISCEIALIWLWLDFSDDQSTLVKVMAWCHQATSLYLRQSWPRSMPPYGITRPQGVNSSPPMLCNQKHPSGHM